MNNKRLFFSMVIPSVLAFALTGVYSIADGYFVGNQLGDNGLAAINFAYPITAFILAVGTGVGLAGAVRFSILNGQKQEADAGEVFANTSLLLLIFGAILTILVLLLLNPLLHLLGADGAVYNLAVEYTRIIALGAIFQVLATGFIPFIRNMGGATYAMVTMILGFGSNILLDYILIWVCDMGMFGAAFATVLGQAISLAASIGYFVKKKFRVHISVKEKLVKSFCNVTKTALAPFGLTFSSNITLILMNRYLMVYYGEKAVAAYACIAYIVIIGYLLLQGVGDGCQPLISLYFGEKDFQKEKETMHLAYFTSAVIAVICMIIMYLFRDYIGMLFGASSETSADVARYLPLFLAPMLPLAYIRITTTYLYATEKTWLSYLLVYAEPVLLFVLLLLLPHINAISKFAVWIAVPIAQFITWCISVLIKRNSFIDSRV